MSLQALSLEGRQLMDFQAIVDGMVPMTCVVSVEKLDGDQYGEIRIVAGNRPYIDSIEKPAPGTEMLSQEFVPNSKYTRYLTRDLNFETACYRAAVQKKCLHSYAHPDRMEVWLNMNFLPLMADEGNLCYCLYMMEINFVPDSESMADLSEKTAAQVLNTCIKLRGTTDFKATMRDVIKDVRDLCDAEHCCILTVNEFFRSCAVLGEAFSADSKLLPMENYVDASFYDIAASWEGTIAGSNCLIVKNEQDMDVVKERNPVWHESLTSAGAYNIILFPLKSQGQLLGYMWAINYDATRAIEIKETLELTTFIVGSELGNFLLMDRLKILSSKDMLTGVNNRNEMNNYVEELCTANSNTHGPVGVIFADLNGLKRMNDEKGHNAGDNLLRDAAQALREVFDDGEIFRAGGDEFSIILSGIEEDVLQKKIEEVREACAHYDRLSFALGGATEPDSRNVRKALKNADVAMYEDKRRYYEAHPEERRGSTPKDNFLINYD